LTRDADQADEVAVAVTGEMARCEIGLRPPVVGAPGPLNQVRVICKPEKDLKPQELTADMTPIEFAYWVDAFESYHADIHMEVATIAVQQAFFQACVHLILYNQIKSNIVSGITTVLGPGNTVMGLMRDEFLLEHSLFARGLAFFRFKQAKGQSMSDAVNDLQRLSDQSDLDGLSPEDLYVMRYLTITDDLELLDKLLEVEDPTPRLLKDATRHYENAGRTKKTLAGSAAMAAYTEPGAEANAVGRGRGRGRGRGSEHSAREKAPWVRDPNLPYTQEQCKKILSWYHVRELCSKCGTKKKKGEKHVCRAGNSTCKKCKHVGHFDPHCFGNWKPLSESRQVTDEADFTSLQVDESEYQYSDSESDTTEFMSVASRSRN
jgi:hypothetical protein